MSALPGHVAAKLGLTWFGLVNRRRFRNLGAKARLFSPYRLDGGENIDLGAESSLQRGGWLYCIPESGGVASLEIGRGCIFGYSNHIACVREVVVGDYVLTANNVYIADNTHSFEDVRIPVMHQPVRFKSRVWIGSGSWIGENSCVIGATIGRNCVIGANSVVTRDIPDFCVAVGAPARIIRRFDTNLGRWGAVE